MAAPVLVGDQPEAPAAGSSADRRARLLGPLPRCAMGTCTATGEGMRDSIGRDRVTGCATL